MAAVRSSKNRTSIRQLFRSGEIVYEMADYGEIMGVDERVILSSIQGVLHDVAKGIKTHEDGRAIWGRDFGPEGLEDGPGDVGVSGAKLAEAGERDVVLEGDGEGVFLGYLYVL
jgi:hypothetical protein